MKMSKSEYDFHEHCQSMYVIDYETAYGKGHMEVKTSFYEKYLKKFTRAFKDSTIISFKEVRCS